MKAPNRQFEQFGWRHFLGRWTFDSLIKTVGIKATSWFIVLFWSMSVLEASGSLIVTSSDRGVLASATGPSGPIFDSHSTPLPGSYLRDASVFSPSFAWTLTSDAHQESYVPGFTGTSISGTGLASVVASVTGTAGFSNTAVTSLDVNFEVATTGVYSLDADVSWSGTTPPFGGYAKVEVLNTSAGTTVALAYSDASSPGVHSVHRSYLLTAGIHYKLNCWADASGGSGGLPGSYSAAASWEVVLSTVPEANSLFLCCHAALLLGASSERRRKASDRNWLQMDGRRMAIR
jgi:hypothetical protein